MAVAYPPISHAGYSLRPLLWYWRAFERPPTEGHHLGDPMEGAPKQVRSGSKMYNDVDYFNVYLVIFIADPLGI